ncbi:hypothetical protein SNEBB_009464 [Seison nebaliae]|nr:hypothetical protein SNEBB_009464 [Seison nebaliae]
MSTEKRIENGKSDESEKSLENGNHENFVFSPSSVAVHRKLFDESIDTTSNDNSQLTATVIGERMLVEEETNDMKEERSLNIKLLNENKKEVIDNRNLNCQPQYPYFVSHSMSTAITITTTIGTAITSTIKTMTTTVDGTHNFTSIIYKNANDMDEERMNNTVYERSYCCFNSDVIDRKPIQQIPSAQNGNSTNKTKSQSFTLYRDSSMTFSNELSHDNHHPINYEGEKFSQSPHSDQISHLDVNMKIQKTGDSTNINRPDERRIDISSSQFFGSCHDNEKSTESIHQYNNNNNKEKIFHNYSSPATPMLMNNNLSNNHRPLNIGGNKNNNQNDNQLYQNHNSKISNTSLKEQSFSLSNYSSQNYQIPHSLPNNSNSNNINPPLHCFPHWHELTHSDFGFTTSNLPLSYKRSRSPSMSSVKSWAPGMRGGNCNPHDSFDEYADSPSPSCARSPMMMPSPLMKSRVGTLIQSELNSNEKELQKEKSFMQIARISSSCENIHIDKKCSSFLNPSNPTTSSSSFFSSSTNPNFLSHNLISHQSPSTTATTLSFLSHQIQRDSTSSHTTSSSKCKRKNCETNDQCSSWNRSSPLSSMISYSPISLGGSSTGSVSSSTTNEVKTTPTIISNSSPNSINIKQNSHFPPTSIDIKKRQYLSSTPQIVVTSFNNNSNIFTHHHPQLQQNDNYLSNSTSHTLSDSSSVTDGMSTGYLTPNDDALDTNLFHQQTKRRRFVNESIDQIMPHDSTTTSLSMNNNNLENH